jgi:hypothetical protein
MLGRGGQWIGHKVNQYDEVILCIGYEACSSSEHVRNATGEEVFDALFDLVPSRNFAKNVLGFHGNSKRSSRPQHLYAIIDTHDMSIYKYGISGIPLNKNGTSARANLQVGVLNSLPSNRGRYKATIMMQGIPGRAAALSLEYAFVYGYAAINNGRKPPGNRRP